jgi:hypothetical protein
MLKYYKKIILTLILVFSSSSLALAESDKSLTLSGASGFIEVPSVDTINGFAVGLYIPTNFDKVGILPRFAVGFIDILELYGGVDIPVQKGQKFGGMLGVKWRFFTGSSVKLGLIANFQFNVLADTLYFNPQVLIGADWTAGDIETSAVFGKTFGKFTSWKRWDFGIGVKWWFLNNGNFDMGWVTDFANFNYRNTGLRNYPVGSNERGNVSSSLRFGFIDKMILLDIGGLDLLDPQRAFYASISFGMGF